MIAGGTRGRAAGPWLGAAAVALLAATPAAAGDRPAPGLLAQAAAEPGAAPPPEWSYAAEVGLYFDSFRSDDGLIESDQLSEMFAVRAARENLWRAGDAFALALEGGFAQAWPRRGGADRFVDATPTDIQVAADYSTWDGRTPGVTLELFVNLPTGPDKFDLVEAAAIPNTHLVSVPILSDGFQIGGEAQYHWRRGAWHLRGGLGYTYRDGVADFEDFIAEELAGGHDITALFGAERDVSERLHIGVEVEYTYSIEKEDDDNQYLALRLPLTYLFEGGEVWLAYTLSSGSSEAREPSEILLVKQDFLDSLKHTLSLEVAYRVSEPLLVKGFAELSLGEADRSTDPAFFATGDRYYVGFGAEYRLAPNLSLRGTAKYFEVSTEGADGGTTTFDGVSAMLGLRYGF